MPRSDRLNQALAALCDGVNELREQRDSVALAEANVATLALEVVEAYELEGEEGEDPAPEPQPTPEPPPQEPASGTPEVPLEPAPESQPLPAGPPPAGMQAARTSRRPAR